MLDRSGLRPGGAFAAQRHLRRCAALLAGALLLAAALPADAHGRLGPRPRARVGVIVGAPLVVGGAWGWYGAPWPAPLYAPPLAVPAPVYVQPPVAYVQQPPEAQQAPAPAGASWYWCAEPAGYWPSVAECPGGWTPVAPR